MLNVYRNPKPTLHYQESEDYVDLTQGVWLTGLWVRITAVVSIAGGSTDGTVLDGNPARLMKRLKVTWDGDEIVDASGRMIRALTRRCVSQGLQEDALASAGAGVGAEPISGMYLIPFARPYLMNPFDTVLPPLDVQSELRLYVEWETAKSGGTSDAGTGALVAGGDRNVTFDSEPDLDVTEMYAISGKTPWALPYISELTSFEQYNNATDPLVGQLTNRNRFDSILLQTVQGSNQQAEDAIDHVTFRAGSTRFIDNASRQVLRDIERYQFPGVDIDDTGYLWLPFADSGKLGNAIDPRELSNPRLELDVSAPAGNPGRARALMMELKTDPKYTRLKG